MMQFGRFRFSPPWWGWLSYLLVVALLLSLGNWQLQRAQAKEVLLAAQQTSGDAEGIDLLGRLMEGEAPVTLYQKTVSVSGRYL
ncbi:MAG: SURF1 family cytochrome oxidase biogenesis protein, partial [Salinisphaeraceae bacterium]|nr:SURF1 family cytochrome oxidase biogenesis protein [Salinisphaeraceae bacterium]